MAKRRYLKERRLRRYYSLIREGMLPIEAREFSKIPKMRDPNDPFKTRPVFPPALRKVVKERQELVKFVNGLAKDMGWGQNRRQYELRKLVIADYRNIRKGIVDRLVKGRKVGGKVLSPWRLYDEASESLPEIDGWDTPRHTYRSGAHLVRFQAASRYKVKELKKDIAFLEKDIRLHGDPHGATAFRIEGLRYQLRTGDY